MTCIVGLTTEDGILMGADSAAANGWQVRSASTPKLFLTQGFLIGYTTSFRMGQLLHYQLEIEEQRKEPDQEYMVCKFIEAVRECFNEHGYMKVEGNREEGGVFLVGYKGHLYEVHDDLQVLELEDGMGACGCGRDYALGVMKLLEHFNPSKRISKALEVASYFSGAVIPPFHIMELPNA